MGKDGDDLVTVTLSIRKGGLDGYPKSARIARSWSWEKVAELLSKESG